ncbi:MAG: epimerase, partial [Candidatus Electrothrix sp. AR4]|nr:epimerase [Candidatus Electrothrix sp. AR4]
QPIHVDDLADLAVRHGKETENTVIDAIGPETFTYRDLMKTVAEIIGKRRPIVSVPPGIGYLTGLIIGKLLNDVLITKEEIEGLMTNLLYVDSPPTGNTKLTEWAEKHSETLGRRYSNELARRLDRETEYSTS